MNRLKVGALYGFNEQKELKRKPSVKLPLPRCNVGIEVELEDISWQMHVDHALSAGSDKVPVNQWWNIVRDGSLRGDSAFEYVSNILFGEDIIDGLSWLEDTIASHNASHRASLHIHLDVRDFTVDELLYFKLVNAFLTPAMMRYVDPFRKYVSYCTPEQMSSALFERDVKALRIFREYMKKGSGLQQCMLKDILQCGKYHAVNYGAMNDYGTVEYRHHHTTTDAKEILSWISIIMRIKKICIGKNPFRDLVKQIHNVYGIERFVNNIIPSLRVDDELREELESSFDYIRCILNASKARRAKEHSTEAVHNYTIDPLDIIRR